MAVKFPLKMSDGTLVKTIEELRDHFNFTDVLAYYSNGRLTKWLEDRFYDEEAGKVKALDSKSESLKKDLCSILGIEYLEDEADKIDLNDVLKKNERLEQLRVYTVDDRILAAVDRVAFTQEELEYLLNSGIKKIYLCGERFILSGDKNGITYIGVHDPVPTVEFDSVVISPDIDIRCLDFDLLFHLKKNDICFFESFINNPKLGLKILRKKAEENSAMAQTVLGECYISGFGGRKDNVEAVKWFSKAAHLGNAKAQSKLAHCYRYGEGIEKNIEKAIEWSQKAADQGNIEAQTRMGIFYETGLTGKKDFEEAVTWFRKAAEQGGSMAEYYLGLCYKDGIGVLQNREEAVKWLKKAFLQGVNKARDVLMEIEPNLFKLSEVIIYAIGGRDNLGYCRYLQHNIEIVVHDREKVNKAILERMGARDVQIFPRYHEYARKKNLQERLVRGVKEGAKFGFLGYAGMAFGTLKGIADEAEEIVKEDTGGGCVYMSMILNESMKVDFIKNILAQRNEEDAAEENEIPYNGIVEDAVNDLNLKINADMDKTYSIQGLMWEEHKQKENAGMETLRMHLGNDIVFTGTWTEAEDEHKLADDELLEGELSANIFTIGYYTIRSSIRLYRDNNAVHYMERIPAGSDEVAAYKAERCDGILSGVVGDGVRKVHEISARYNYDKEGFLNEWHYICLATSSYRWAESINFICTVKHDATKSDEQAFLFVLNQYVGDSYGVEKWYKFSPDGMLQEYQIHPFDKEPTKISWENE